MLIWLAHESQKQVILQSNLCATYTCIWNIIFFPTFFSLQMNPVNWALLCASHSHLSFTGEILIMLSSKQNVFVCLCLPSLRFGQPLIEALPTLPDKTREMFLSILWTSSCNRERLRFLGELLGCNSLSWWEVSKGKWWICLRKAPDGHSFSLY